MDISSFIVSCYLQGNIVKGKLIGTYQRKQFYLLSSCSIKWWLNFKLKYYNMNYKKTADKCMPLYCIIIGYK